MKWQPQVGPPPDNDDQAALVAEERKETTVATTSEAELFRALPGWQRYGNRIEKTFNFDDLSAEATASLWRSLLGTVAT
jgi:hypothetical protein